MVLKGKDEKQDFFFYWKWKYNKDKKVYIHIYRSKLKSFPEAFILHLDKSDIYNLLFLFQLDVFRDYCKTGKGRGGISLYIQHTIVQATFNFLIRDKRINSGILFSNINYRNPSFDKRKIDRSTHFPVTLKRRMILLDDHPLIGRLYRRLHQLCRASKAHARSIIYAN